MWGKTYQCQISNAGGWFIGVRFSKFHDFSMTFDDFFQSSMTFHDFSRKFYFSRFSRPCGNPAASLAICEWNPLVTVGFPSQRAMKKCRKCFHVMHHHDCSIIFTQTRIPEVYSFRSQYSCGIRTWGRLVTSQLKFCGDKVILQQSCLSGIFL